MAKIWVARNPVGWQDDPEVRVFATEPAWVAGQTWSGWADKLAGTTWLCADEFKRVFNMLPEADDLLEIELTAKLVTTWEPIKGE